MSPPLKGNRLLLRGGLSVASRAIQLVTSFVMDRITMRTSSARRLRSKTTYAHANAVRSHACLQTSPWLTRNMKDKLQAGLPEVVFLLLLLRRLPQPHRLRRLLRKHPPNLRPSLMSSSSWLMSILESYEDCAHRCFGEFALFVGEDGQTRQRKRCSNCSTDGVPPPEYPVGAMAYGRPRRPVIP